MSDAEQDAYDRHDAYADRVTIVVNPVKHPADGVGPEQWFVVSNGAAWDPHWLEREVESLGLTTSDGALVQRGSYRLEIGRTRHSWGADAAQVQIVMWLAQAAAGGLAWDMLKLTAKTMAQRLSDSRGTSSSAPLTTDEAESRARWLVVMNHHEQEDDLVTEKVETDGNNASVVLFAPSSGWRYELGLEVESELVTLARVKKTRSPGSP